LGLRGSRVRQVLWVLWVLLVAGKERAILAMGRD
jgi:hypothetical protein